jgi:hypothetical protein
MPIRFTTLPRRHSLVLVAVAATACGSPAPSEAERASTSNQEIIIPRIPNIGRLPPSGFGEDGDQKIPLPGSLIPQGAPDPCDVPRGTMRGPGCSGNPGDTYVPAKACDSGSPGCVNGVQPGGFINETTDPAPVPPLMASAGDDDDAQASAGGDDDGSVAVASAGDDDDSSRDDDGLAWRRPPARR